MVREDAEALRRQLYARGASDSDIERYRAAGGREPVVSPEDPGPDSRPPHVPRSWRLRLVPVVAVAAVLAVLAGGIAVGRLASGGTPTAPPPTPVPMSAEDRRDVVQNLALTDSAGIAAFLVTHRALPQLDGAKRDEIVERMGEGDGLVVLSPVSPQAVSGRATVLLVVDGGAQVGWTSLRREVDSTGEQRFVRQARRESLQEPGGITAHTYRYASGNRPVELRITAPEGVRWGAAVLFTD